MNKRTRKFLRSTIALIKSKAGQRVLRESQERAEEIERDLREKQKVDVRRIRPFDI